MFRGSRKENLYKIFISTSILFRSLLLLLNQSDQGFLKKPMQGQILLVLMLASIESKFIGCIVQDDNILRQHTGLNVVNVIEDVPSAH